MCRLSFHYLTLLKTFLLADYRTADPRDKLEVRYAKENNNIATSPQVGH